MAWYWILLISLAGLLILMYASFVIKLVVWALVWITEGIACIFMVLLFPITILSRRTKNEQKE